MKRKPKIMDLIRNYFFIMDPVKKEIFQGVRITEVPSSTKLSVMLDALVADRLAGLLNSLFKFCFIDRFQQIIKDSVPERDLGIFEFVETAEYNNTATDLAVTDLFNQLQTVHKRHPDISEGPDQVSGQGSAPDPARRLGFATIFDIDRLPVDRIADSGADIIFVINNDHVP